MLLVVLLSTLLSSGLTRKLPPGTFSVPLDSEGLHTLYWTLDYDAGTVSLEVHSHVPATSWIALGFSDYGEITDADLCVLWVDWHGKLHLEDTWTDKHGIIYRDQQQDCGEAGYSKSRNITKFVFNRKFDTCDGHDYIIEEGTTHIVWAAGAGPLFRVEGLNLASAKHGFQRTQLLKNLAGEVPLPRDTWAVTVTENNNRVPSTDTTYWCRVVKLSDKLRNKHHVVKFESVITAGNEHLVHHMELFHCEAKADVEMPDYRGPCDGSDRPPETQVCKKVIAAWAMGATPFYYPEEAGYPIGGPDFNLYAVLEIHYNNPQLHAGMVDSSGLRVYVSPTLRAHDAGVIELGLEYIDKMAIPPGQPHFPLSGYCISECTGINLPPEGIIVFGSQLHTHLTGIRVFTRHVRDGRELPNLNRDNHYSTHFQEIRRLKRPVHVIPGDALITTCIYNTTGRSNITVGGFAISDEMCVNYVYYYPAINLEVCKSSISDLSLQTYFRSVNEWENQPTSPKLGISDNYKAIDWTPVRASILNQLYLESPIYMQCNQSSGERFPGDWSSLPVTPVLFSLPPLPRDCPTK
ncbi:dopamine beta-hydroxylase [Macrosteles quadrilineatus]|uniref:dopamine beta-hydroxylase n=1 Tax=Macrosteles quadrilineatus TaxID=74068 RepID=UPI0023E0FB65|nr:dopamine beta-hydroxylase [Macrosteles quadrilineatus]